jgi:hypothetical protein
MPDHGFENGRERAADYISICDNIAGSYPLGPIHGFQKDVIQNALDARSGRSAVEVRIEHVVNPTGSFLVVTDSGTTGLTGPYVKPDQYDEDLPDDYHWARFEGFAFTKRNPDALGARGQGKFILMKASSEYLMYYDTLRTDGVYRFGGTQAKRTGCPILPRDPFQDPWEGKRARAELRARCGLTPLGGTGTRVIVVSPCLEHIDALRTGALASFISETWFRALEKRRLRVTIAVDGVSTEVGIQVPYPLPTGEAGDVRLWTLGKDFHDDHIILSDGTQFRVKKFEMARLESPVHEDLRGVAVIQNNMKIEARQMSSAPSSIADCVAGFIEFDTPLDRELRKGENQHPNHYSLHWRSRVPRAIKAYIEKQMEDFGRSKLGIGRDPREERKRRQSAAEEAALREIARFARDLDIFGRRTGGTPPPPPPPPPNKPVGVSIHGFAYPDPDMAPRVPRGSKFDDLVVEAYNRTANVVDVFVAARVLHGDRVVQTLLEPQTVSVEPGRKVPWPVAFEIGGDYAEPGEYRIKATMDAAETGERIDDVARRFWVDAEPPFRAPFDAEPARGFPEPHHRRQWIVSGYIGTAKVYYNVLHPAYLEAEQADELQDYLRSIFLDAAIELVLNRPDLEDGTADFHPLDAQAILPAGGGDGGEVPLRTYQEIMRYVSDFRWRVLEG